jgi:hypothetical protein
LSRSTKIVADTVNAAPPDVAMGTLLLLQVWETAGFGVTNGLSPRVILLFLSRPRVIADQPFLIAEGD